MPILLALLLSALPACPHEDGGLPVCRWDASRQGNGVGSSLVYIGPVAMSA